MLLFSDGINMLINIDFSNWFVVEVIFSISNFRFLIKMVIKLIDISLSGLLRYIY